MGEVRWDIVAQGLGCHGEYVRLARRICPRRCERARQHDGPGARLRAHQHRGEPVGPAGHRWRASSRSTSGPRHEDAARQACADHRSGVGHRPRVRARFRAPGREPGASATSMRTALEGLRREITGWASACLAQRLRRAERGLRRRAGGRHAHCRRPARRAGQQRRHRLPGCFEETPVAWWRRTFDVNVLGIVHCIQAFLPAMRAAGGERKIVNVASLAGVAPAPNMSAYAASKHAVIGLSEVLALELHDSPVSVLVVCPGIINTNIVKHAGMTAPGISAAQMAEAAALLRGARLPAGRGGGGHRAQRARRRPVPVRRPGGQAGAVLARLSRRLTRRVTHSRRAQERLPAVDRRTQPPPEGSGGLPGA